MPSTSIVNQFRIQLPESTLKDYETQARESGCDLEDLLVRRLVEFKDYDYQKGRSLKITPEERQRLEEAFGRSFKSGSELTNYMSSVYELKVCDVEVQLPTELLRRLKARAIRIPYKQFIQETIIRQLEHIVGLR